jgi:hypothetical protein
MTVGDPFRDCSALGFLPGHNAPLLEEAAPAYHAALKV